MAPVQPSYPSLKEPLPKLDLAKCFAGKQHTMSWEAAYTALCEPTASTSSSLRSFLYSEEGVEALSKPWQPFPAPSAQEKSKFESSTAPINATPSANGGYSLDEIKADSLWLSKLANISEYSALYLVIQEWQERPRAQLLSGLTEEEAVSVNNAIGLSDLGASTFVPNSSIVTAPSSIPDTKFDSEDQRRLRLLHMYLNTRVTILRTSQLLVAWATAKDLKEADEFGDWLSTLGRDIVEKQQGNAFSAVEECLQQADARWNTMDNGFAWDVPEAIQEATMALWLTAHVTEVIHLMHLALLHADHSNRFVEAPVVERWFTSLAEKDFFRNLALPLPDQPHLVPLVQFLASVVSLALLRVNVVLDDLENGRHTSWDSSCYLLNGSVLETITNVFGYAKSLGPSSATPPAFAWAIITWSLTMHASEAEELREHQIEGNPGASVPERTALEDAVLSLTRLEATDGSGEKRMPFQDIAESCESFGVLDIVTQFVDLGMASFGSSVDRISRDRIRFLLLNLLRSALSSSIVAYSPEVIICAHAIMTGERTFRHWIEADAPRQSDPVIAFCLNDTAVLRPLLIDEARIRYPYELTPLLKFFSILTRGECLNDDRLPSTANTLADMHTLMQRLPENFADYRLIREDENANWVALNVDLPQFRAKSMGTRRLLGPNSEIDESLVIPSNTEGNIMDDTQTPYIAMWHYQHSAFDYLVKLLSTYVVGSPDVEFSSQQPVAREHASEIIGFFADLLHSSMRMEDGIPSAELLRALDIGGGHGQDTVSVILAIFEEALVAQCQEPGNPESLELLVNCIHFVQALVRIAPSRVWPWLARSQLLHAEGNGGALASILIGTEMVLGHYDFLIGCIQLFASLIEDAVSGSVARKARGKALTRFNAVATSESGASDKVMSHILMAFGRTLASIYEGSLSWKYMSLEDRLEINIGICGAFKSIMHYAYGVDDNKSISSKATGLLGPVAEYLTDLYLAESANDMAINPLMATLLSGASVDKTTFLTKSAKLWRQQTSATLSFSNTLIRVAILLERPWTHLEQQLFKATPLLARLYATSDVYSAPVLLLLRTLVQGAVRVIDEPAALAQKDAKNGTHTEPPSLLGHLGPKTAKNFLTIVSQLDEPFTFVDNQILLWNLLSTVVTCKQQWFSLFLLTGSTPRESIRSKANSKAPVSRDKGLLTRALEVIAEMDIEKMPTTETAEKDWSLYSATLEFITSSYNNWAWALGSLQAHKDFIQKLLSFLKWLQTQPSGTFSATLRSHLNRFASLTCQMLAMHLHTSRQVGDFSPVKEIVSSLGYLEEHGLRLPEYNASLHAKLKRNFEEHFNGVSLSGLKRTTLEPVPFGRSFFYDIDLADKILRFNGSWAGRAGAGFAGDMIKANLNLGLVESQIELLRSWKLLAVELSNSVDKHEPLAKILVRVVRDSMITNAESTLPEALFGQLTDLRADLSFILLQRMVNAKVKAPEVRGLLKPVWEAVRASTSDFDTVFSNDGVQYYRSLLRILYLALQFHLTDESTSEQDASLRATFRGSLAANPKALVEPISTQLLEVLTDTVAKGFRSLATQLHSHPESVVPSDFALLTAILQTIISIPEMTTWHAQAALLFANCNTVRYASSLFSWADRLTIPNNFIKDPVYGELSILFILSLSSMQPLAETMAVEGILSQLNAANLMNYFRRPGGMSPFDSPPRLFSIWTKGILPLCLNLLQAVGPSIAGEISAFLNQFPEQLSRASNALNIRTASKVSLSLANETHSLALISAILDKDRANGPRLGIQASEIPHLEWDRENVKEDVESWLSRKGALREKIIVLDERDQALFEKRARGAEDGNLLEERVIGELTAAMECLEGAGAGGGSEQGRG